MRTKKQTLKGVNKYVVRGFVYDGGEVIKETFDNIDEAIDKAREIQDGWTDDGTFYDITIYNEQGKKVASVSDDKYFNDLVEIKLFKKVDLSAETKKEREIENQKLKGYKFKLVVRIADGGATGIYEKTFDSIFDLMDKMNYYYEENYYATINNEDLDEWEDRIYDMDENRNYIKGKYGWSFIKEGKLWIAKDDYENNHIVRIIDGKLTSDSSVSKSALKQIAELESQKKYEGDSVKPKVMKNQKNTTPTRMMVRKRKQYADGGEMDGLKMYEGQAYLNWINGDGVEDELKTNRYIKASNEKQAEELFISRLELDTYTSRNNWSYERISIQLVTDQEELEYAENRGYLSQKNNNTYAGGGELSEFKMKLNELDSDGNTSVEYDEENEEWYWEDYSNDSYRGGFESELEAYEDLIDYLESDEEYAKGGKVKKKVRKYKTDKTMWISPKKNWGITRLADGTYTAETNENVIYTNYQTDDNAGYIYSDEQEKIPQSVKNKIKDFYESEYEIPFYWLNKLAEGGELEDWMEEALAYLIEETGYDMLEIKLATSNQFIATDGDVEYRVFKTEDDAEETAIEQVRYDLEENPEYFNQDWLMNYIDGDFFEVTLNDMNDSYVQDIESESDSKYANRLIAELVENGLMDEEDAESDNAEELAIDLKYDYVDLLTREKLEEGNDGLDYFINNFGEVETYKMVMDNNLIDIIEASRDAVSTDGIAHFLSSYDGETLYLYDDYVAYRIN